MSSSNCCFLTWIQEAGQVVWYSHLFHNFLQFIVIHTVKGFGIASKAERDVFLELSWFFSDLMSVQFSEHFFCCLDVLNICATHLSRSWVTVYIGICSQSLCRASLGLFHAAAFQMRPGLQLGYGFRGSSSLVLSGIPFLSPGPSASFSLFSGQKVRFHCSFSLQREVARKRKWCFLDSRGLFPVWRWLISWVFGAEVATVAVLWLLVGPGKIGGAGVFLGSPQPLSGSREDPFYLVFWVAEGGFPQSFWL